MQTFDQNLVFFDSNNSDVTVT